MNRAPFLPCYDRDQLQENLDNGDSVVLAEDSGTGFILSRECDLENVFKPSAVKVRGQWAVSEGLARGAKTLDCYGCEVDDLYRSLGLGMHVAYEWIASIRPRVGAVTLGTPDVAFMQSLKPSPQHVRKRSWRRFRLAGASRRIFGISGAPTATELTFETLRQEMLQKMDRKNIKRTARGLPLDHIDREESRGASPKSVRRSMLVMWNESEYINQTF